MNLTWKQLQNSIHNTTIHSANRTLQWLSVPHLHTEATKSSLPSSAMYRMLYSYNFVLLFAGSTDMSIHAQSSPASSPAHVYAIMLMK